ncbi:MAG: hypothetical protein WKF83_10255 [Nocardioidaceae bacterium]
MRHSIARAARLDGYRDDEPRRAGDDSDGIDAGTCSDPAGGRGQPQCPRGLHRDVEHHRRARRARRRTHRRGRRRGLGPARAAHAADVGIQPGEKTSDFQTGVPRRIRLLLPEGFELETVGPLLGFDNYGHPQEPSRSVVELRCWTPSTMFVKSAPLEPSAAYEGFKRDLAAVGLPPDAAETWLAR